MVGKLPPPYGGITIHSKRLYQTLYENDYNVYFINIKKNKFIMQLYQIIKIKRNGIIHIHLSNLLVILLITLLAKLTLKKVVVTFHSFRNKNFFHKLVTVFILLISNKVIAVGNTVESDIKKINFKKNNIKMINSFIPPTKEELLNLRVPIEIFNKLDNSSFKIAINAYQLILEKGTDLYGIKTGILLAERLIQNKKDIQLYICLGSIGNKKYYYELIEYIQLAKLEERIHFIIGYELLPILSKIDLFVRPTTSDAFGVSIAEALFLQKSVIASDVCERPDGTIIYHAGNLDELYQKTEEVIENKNLIDTSINNLYKSYNKIIKLYSEI